MTPLVIYNNSPQPVVVQGPSRLILRPQYGSGVKGDTGSTLIPMSIKGTLVVGIGVIPLPMPTDGEISSIMVAVSPFFPPSGASIIFDVLKNGVSIFTSGPRPTILAGQTVSAPVVPDDVTFSAGDVYTVDVVQVGSIQPGSHATLIMDVA